MSIVDDIRQDFARRRSINPSLSLRSYAKIVDYDASTLAKFLAGERRPGLQTEARLARSLRKEVMRPEATQLSDDHFRVICDWYHFAILELTRLKDFRPDPLWMARRLKISVHDVRDAILRLERIGALQTTGRKWVIKNLTTTGISGSNPALRQMQRQILEKSLEALGGDFERRSHSSMTMAIDKSRLPEAKRLISDFRKKISDLLETSDHLDEVYLFSISLFPATHH